MIQRVIIRNYRILRQFDLSLGRGKDLILIVGDNESGKSTLLEAIGVALTRRLNGRPLDTEITAHLFNNETVATYLEEIRAGKNPQLPEIRIELYLADLDELQQLRGANNSEGLDTPGVSLEVAFSDDFREDYEKLLDSRHTICALPAEYYRVKWQSFAGSSLTSRSLGIGVSYIDATTIRLQSGTDYYLQSLIEGHLDPRERVALAVAYRRLKEAFAREPAIQALNGQAANRRGIISQKDLTLSIDTSHRTVWETSLTPHLGEVPFPYIGKGEQNAVKLMLALERSSPSAQVVLIEEPENHLSYSSMHRLLQHVTKNCEGKQIFATTHSAFVLNKLGLDNVILLRGDRAIFLSGLPEDTADYFRKLPGYDTLRVILAKKVILVEGPSDELVVQKAYRQVHNRLPIEDGIDVLSVRGLSFRRFLEISARLKVPTKVVTDNDGDWERNVEAKYHQYSQCPFIKICASKDDSLPTLESHLVECNSLSSLNAILNTSFANAQDLEKHMRVNKTDCALRIFNAAAPIFFPQYVVDAVCQE